MTVRISSLTALALMMSGCSDAPPPPAAAADEAADQAAPESAPPPAPLVDEAPKADLLAPLLELVRASHGVLDEGTRDKVLKAIDRAVTRAELASDAEGLPRAQGERAGSRVIQHVKDAVLPEVKGAIVLADGTVRIDRAVDTLVVATDAAFVRECRGCTIIAGRLVAASDVKPGEKSPMSLVWSGIELDVEDAAGAVLAGPMAGPLAARLGVVAADGKRLGALPAFSIPAAPRVAAVAIEAVEGQPTFVTMAANEGGTRERVTVGRAVSVGADGEPWRLVQGFGWHVALRRGDDVALLSVEHGAQK